MEGWRDMGETAGADAILGAGFGLFGDLARGLLLIGAIAAIVLGLYALHAARLRAVALRTRRLVDASARARAERPAPAPPARRGRPIRLPSLYSGCWWRETDAAPGPRLRRWICVDCGFTAYGAGDLPPRDCKRDLRAPGF